MVKLDLASRRRAGVLLHPTCLPGPHGIGDLGASAHRFVDWLADAGMSIWQVLPLGPTADGCPYVSWSSFAGNPELVDLEGLVRDGLLEPGELGAPLPSTGRVDFRAARAHKRPLLAKAADRLLAGHPLARELGEFRASEREWLDDAAAYAVISATQGGRGFWDWPAELRDRAPRALARFRSEHAREIDRVVASLFFFERQWRALHAHARARGVAILGDVPIYVDRSSADVWADRALFELDERALPREVSGVPPDYFSAKGQLWGHPLYAWDRHARDDFAWWRRRLARALALVDAVRIDHFRAFAAYWAVPFGAADARGGRFRRGPGLAFFEAARRHAGELPLVAEDLGLIDDEVHALRRAAGLPGMRVLQFAFGGDRNDHHLPHQHTPDSVVYPGTHDNDTTLGWWRAAPPHVREHAQRYLRVSGDDVAWDLVRAAFASPARTAIVAMQDVLQLGTEARMNDPSRADGNWRFRLESLEVAREAGSGLRYLAELYGRL